MCFLKVLTFLHINEAQNKTEKLQLWDLSRNNEGVLQVSVVFSAGHSPKTCTQNPFPYHIQAAKCPPLSLICAHFHHRGQTACMYCVCISTCVFPISL